MELVRKFRTVFVLFEQINQIDFFINFFQALSNFFFTLIVAKLVLRRYEKFYLLIDQIEELFPSHPPRQQSNQWHIY
jgi:hypothetical protein